MKVKSKVCDTLITILDGIANDGENTMKLFSFIHQYKYIIIMGLISIFLYFVFYYFGLKITITKSQE